MLTREEHKDMKMTNNNRIMEAVNSSRKRTLGVRRDIEESFHDLKHEVESLAEMLPVGEEKNTLFKKFKEEEREYKYILSKLDELDDADNKVEKTYLMAKESIS